MKLDDVINLEDIRLLAKGYLPRIAFDFIDGGVEDEAALDRNRSAYDRYKLLPRYLVDVSSRSQSVDLFGKTYASPVGISPMGVCGLFRPGADLMMAQAAARADVPYIMSSASCESIEAAMRVAPENTWFQLYGTKDPAINVDLVDRARALNVPVLLFTLDTPVMAKRERNLRNGYRRPMKMTLGVILQGLRRPAWTARYLRHRGIPLMENWAPYAPPGASPNQVADMFGSQTPAPGQTWDVLKQIRANWKGPLIAKGVLHPLDARKCAEMGVDGVIVSNHGGRQLDAAVSSLDMLPAVVDEVGSKIEVMIDGGIRRGADVVTALSLGARATFFGRPPIFGAAAAKSAGVDKVLAIIRHEIDLVMGQMGRRDIGELDTSGIVEVDNGAFRYAQELHGVERLDAIADRKELSA